MQCVSLMAEMLHSCKNRVENVLAAITAGISESQKNVQFLYAVTNDKGYDVFIPRVEHAMDTPHGHVDGGSVTDSRCRRYDGDFTASRNPCDKRRCLAAVSPRGGCLPDLQRSFVSGLGDAIRNRRLILGAPRIILTFWLMRRS